MIIILSLLLVASSAERIMKASESDFDRKHMAPADKLAVLFYSKDRSNYKLKAPDEELEQDGSWKQVSPSSGDATKYMVFVLDFQEDDKFIIRDALTRRRVRCLENTQLPLAPTTSGMDDSQLWKFEAVGEGFYEIRNVKFSDRCLGIEKEDKWTGCWNRGDNGESWGKNKYWKWRLEDIFEADALWAVLKTFHNNYDITTEFSYQMSVGYTASIEQSQAHTSSVSESLEFSANGALKALGLGFDETTTFTEEFSQSVSSAMSGTFETTTQMSVKVEPGKCIRILQLRVVQDDPIAKVTGMTFYSSDIDLRSCTTDDVEGSMALAMATSESTGPHWAVKVFAVVGFVASVYGAVCHYTGPKEEVTL